MRRRLVLLALAVVASTGAVGCLNEDLNDPRPSRMEVEGGNAQTVAPGLRAPTPLMVQVFDQYRNVMPGQTVTWRVESGGGSVSEATTTTNSSGIAQVLYTAGSTAGTVTVAATLASLGTLNFTLTVATPTGT